jgi:hypothetical protein
MYFIATGTNVHPELFEPYLAEERAVVAQQRAEGFVKALYIRVDGGGVISVMEADSPDEAARQLARLPLVRHGLLTFALTEVEVL